MPPKFATLFRVLAVVGAIEYFLIGAAALLFLWLALVVFVPSLRNPREDATLSVLSGIPLAVAIAVIALPPGYIRYSALPSPLVRVLLLFAIAYLVLAAATKLRLLHSSDAIQTRRSIRALEALAVAFSCNFVLNIEFTQSLALTPAQTLAVILLAGAIVDLLVSLALRDVATEPIIGPSRPAATSVRAPRNSSTREETIQVDQRTMHSNDSDAPSHEAEPQPDRSNTPSPTPTAAPAMTLPTVSEIPQSGSGRRMQLKLTRAQRSGITGKVIFTMDARMEVPAEERQLIDKYRLGNLVIYDSTTRQKHTDATQAHLESTKDMPGYREGIESQLMGTGKMLYRFARAGVSAAMAGLSLRVTVASLMQGVHVECKSMDELLGAENAIIQAGETLRTYLDTAETFDGRETVLEF